MTADVNEAFREAGQETPPATIGLVVVATAGGVRLALPAAEVRMILAMVPLWRPPTLPPVVAGFLAMAAHTLPVLHTARLLGLPAGGPPGLHAHILIVPALGGGLLVDRAEQAMAVGGWMPVPATETLNGCAVATADAGGAPVHLLSVAHLLQAGEAARLATLTEQARARRAGWEDAA